MTQIVLNPEQLAQTASTLQNAAGEYQAIGAQVCGCDCGCMPADVAATVDAVTAEVRGGLSGIAGDISVQAADLAQRAGIDQNGGFSAVGAAWGGGQTIDVGGYSSDIFNQALQPVDMVIGGSFDIFDQGLQPYTTYVGGGDFDIFDQGTNPNGYDLVVGGDFSLGGGGGGTDLITGGDFTIGGGGGGVDLITGGDFTIGGDTGGSVDLITGGDFTITPTYDSTDAMATLMGMAQARGDWWTMSMLNNIQTMQNIGTEIWTLPDGWGIEYGGMTYW
jgi:hypothetical protein